MAEWSKAVRLRRTIVKMHGFEPHSVQFIFLNNNSSILIIFLKNYLKTIDFHILRTIEIGYSNLK